MAELSLDLRVEAEHFRQWGDYLDASDEYYAAMPSDEMRTEMRRRSLRAYGFFNTPMWNYREFIFCYQMRYGDDPTKRSAGTEGA